MVTDQNFILTACDIIIINSITMIFALILVKKTSETWRVLTEEPETNYDDAEYSGKKVVFEEGESHEKIGIEGEDYEEINGKLSSKLMSAQKKIFNEYY